MGRVGSDWAVVRCANLPIWSTAGAITDLGGGEHNNGEDADEYKAVLPEVHHGSTKSSG